MTEVSRIYEGMFLLGAGQSDFEAATQPIKTILERRDAEVLSIKPWDERRLAYEIRDRKRGQYVLIYFKVNPSQITEMEHDCQLDERILRSMFIRCDKNAEKKVEAETPAMASQRRAAEAETARAARAEAEAKAKAEQDSKLPAEPAEDEAKAKTEQQDEQESKQTDEVAKADAAKALNAPIAEAASVDAPAESPAEAPATDAPAESSPKTDEKAAAEDTDENQAKSD